MGSLTSKSFRPSTIQGQVAEGRPAAPSARSSGGFRFPRPCARNAWFWCLREVGQSYAQVPDLRGLTDHANGRVFGSRPDQPRRARASCPPLRLRRSSSRPCRRLGDARHVHDVVTNPRRPGGLGSRLAVGPCSRTDAACVDTAPGERSPFPSPFRKRPHHRYHRDLQRAGRPRRQ